MLDDGCFFPFILMNLGKLKCCVFVFVLNLSNWLMTLLKKLLMADVLELLALFYSFGCAVKRILSRSHFSKFPGIWVGSISFLEAFKVCERNTVVLHTELCST